MKLRIYVDTSVLGGCYDPEFEVWSNKLIAEAQSGKKILVISDVTLSEIEHAPEVVREVIKFLPEDCKEYIFNNDESEALADLYIKEGAVPSKFYEDALHIAMATIWNVNVLVSWNFKHIVNFDRIRKYNAVNVKNGYRILEIRNPREVIDDSDR